MRQILTVLLFIGLSVFKIYAQSLHPIVAKAKEISLYSEKINWKEVNANFLELSKDKQDLKPALQYLINSLGDKHAQVRSTEDYSLVLSYTGELEESESAERDAHFVNTVINDVSAKFSYALLDDHIGYLRVVGIGPGDVKAQADFIRSGLIDLKNQGVNKWIIDLRYNGGGNMEPMLSGLAPLLGDGKIGGSVNHKEELVRHYIIENGEFNNNGRVACEMNNEPNIQPDEKVAVLLSRYTISSGELVAVAFKGRKNTRYFGEKSAGYTTGNGFEPINDTLALIISQDVFADRNNNIYRDRVDVDEYIEFQHTTEIEEDNMIDKAVEWLLTEKKK